jgi:hypothetical protein
MIKERIDISRISVVGLHLIEQIGKVRLQLLVYKRIFGDLHRCQIKQGDNVRRQVVADQIGRQLRAR